MLLFSGCALALVVFFFPNKSADVLDFHSNISELSRNSAAIYTIKQINPSAISEEY